MGEAQASIQRGIERQTRLLTRVNSRPAITMSSRSVASTSFSSAGLASPCDRPKRILSIVRKLEATDDALRSEHACGNKSSSTHKAAQEYLAAAAVPAVVVLPRGGARKHSQGARLKTPLFTAHSASPVAYARMS